MLYQDTKGVRVSVCYKRVQQSLLPLSNHDIHIGIDYNRSRVVNALRNGRLVLQLDIVRQNNVCEHRLHLIRDKESTRTDHQLRIKQRTRETAKQHLPCISTMSERQIIQAGRNELVLRTFSFRLSHSSEPEGVKLCRVFVYIIV